MPVDVAFRIEVETIHQLMDSFDYYQLLKIDRKAPATQVQQGFFRESRTFHPDRYFGLEDEELKSWVMDIYKRISEAYGILKDPELRAHYDEQLEAGAGLRLDRTALEAANRGAQAPEAVATTLQGRKFLALGLDALKRKDYNGAVMNLQFALSAEPANKAIEEYLQEARKGAHERKGPANPYKVRF